ncbi:MAG: membrane protein insertion efficiency factor YidD [Planctomycetota bacterium]
MSRMPRRTPLTLPFEWLIRLYQLTLSPFMGGQCRFQPTCSHYGLEAYRVHGVIGGTWLTLRRMLRCQPWGGSGFDPVPPLEKQARATDVSID